MSATATDIEIKYFTIREGESLLQKIPNLLMKLQFLQSSRELEVIFSVAII